MTRQASDTEPRKPSTTPFTDAIEERVIMTEDGAIFENEDAKRLLAVMRKLEILAQSGPFNIDRVITALLNGHGDTYLQGRLLDGVLFPSHQEIKP